MRIRVSAACSARLPRSTRASHAGRVSRSSAGAAPGSAGGFVADRQAGQVGEHLAAHLQVGLGHESLRLQPCGTCRRLVHVGDRPVADPKPVLGLGQRALDRGLLANEQAQRARPPARPRCSVGAAQDQHLLGLRPLAIGGIGRDLELAPLRVALAADRAAGAARARSDPRRRPSPRCRTRRRWSRRSPAQRSARRASMSRPLRTPRRLRASPSDATRRRPASGARRPHRAPRARRRTPDRACARPARPRRCRAHARPTPARLPARARRADLVRMRSSRSVRHPAARRACAG